MALKDSSSGVETVCPTCGKRIAQASRVGSLTSYLFQSLYCGCADLDARPSATASLRRPKTASNADQDTNFDMCPECGLRRAKGGSLGTITGYLFQDTRCKCGSDLQSAQSERVEKFWKLKQTGAGSTFGDDLIAGLSKSSQLKTINLIPGTVIGGAYRIVRLIGKGGMGEVYLAEHLSLRKTCAIKVIPPGQVTDTVWQRFQNEARTIAALDHVTLVKVTDLGIHEECLPYYAMEYIRGQTLAEMLQEHGRMPLDCVLDVFMQLCDGIDYAHRKGIVHRDLKPGNIMLVKSQTGKISVKILDFGLVKLVQRDRHQQSLTSVGDVFGSPLYMSPEQASGGKVDNRSDIYSLGCTMFESLTGRPPFIAESTVAIVLLHQKADRPSLDSVVGPNIFPESMEVVLAKLLRKNPVERYQTLLELRGDLEKVARGEEVQPFYLSRAKQMPASARTAAGTTGREELASGGLPLPFSIRTAIICGLILITLVWFAAASILAPKKLISHKETFVGVPHLVEGEADLRAALKSRWKPPPVASLNETEPFSRIGKADGREWRVFNFPPDASIGTIDKYQNLRGKMARGKVQFPAEERLFFLPAVAVMNQAACFRRFQSGDIYQLRVPSFNPILNKPTADYLEALSVIPGIKSLDVTGCDDLANKNLSSLEKFSAIQALHIGPTDLDPGTLSKLSTLKNLQIIELIGYPDVTPVLKALENSTKLTSLTIFSSGSSYDGMEAVARMPNLNHLCLDQLTPNKPDFIVKSLEILSNAAALKTLTIRHAAVPVDGMKALARFKSLDNLQIDRLAPSDSATTIAALKLLSPAPKLRTIFIQEFCMSGGAMEALKPFGELEHLYFGRQASKLSIQTIQGTVKAFSKFEAVVPSDKQDYAVEIRVRQPGGHVHK